MNDSNLFSSGGIDSQRMTFHTPCKEIRGETAYFLRLFGQMHARYPNVRITAEPDGGVALRFEGNWPDYWRQHAKQYAITHERAPATPTPEKRSWLTRLISKGWS